MKSNSSTVDRARLYLSKIPPAVSGQNGHADTFKVASVAVNGFGLNESDALLVLSEWNMDCDPPWSRADLLHKIQDAAKAPSTKPRGYLLKDRNTIPERRPDKPKRPDRSGFSKGTPAQIEQLAEARSYGTEGLDLANERGHLVFGDWHGQKCYGVTDKSGRVLEIRRMDQQPFPAFGTLSARKSHAVRGSQKSWPVGIAETEQAETILLLEGLPDFLVAHSLILAESGEHPHLVRTVAPVAMLSSSPAISDDALKCFEGKKIRVFPHLENAGYRGARKWADQLTKAGALQVDFIDFSEFVTLDGGKVNDLFDFSQSTQPMRCLSWEE